MTVTHYEKRPMTKERVIVMNGSRLLEQATTNDKWAVKNVEDAKGIRAGIYNIYTATESQTGESSGQIIHADKNFAYQMVGKNRFLKHATKVFDKSPEVGKNVTISYENNGKAKVAEASVKQSRSR